MAPTAQPEDDGGFTPSWVDQQQHQLGPMQSTEESRREIQELPPTRPPPPDDDEESEYLMCVRLVPIQKRKCVTFIQHYFIVHKIVQTIYFNHSLFIFTF